MDTEAKMGVKKGSTEEVRNYEANRHSTKKSHIPIFMIFVFACLSFVM